MLSIVILLFLCVHSNHSVINRIKSVRIVSYGKNQITSTLSFFSEFGRIGQQFPTATNSTTAPKTITIPIGPVAADARGQPISSNSTVTSGTTTSIAGVQHVITNHQHTNTTLRDAVFTAGLPAVSTVHSSDPSTTTAKHTIVSILPLKSGTSKPVKTTLPTTSSASTTFQVPMEAAGNLTDRAGHFHISSTGRLFFWFFRSQSSSTDPVVVWLQGQPNASSMYGAIDETGPFYIDQYTKSIQTRKHSWASCFNVLYLDPYPGCGFSYSDNSTEYSKTYESVSRGIIRALQQFYTLYPQLKANSLYLAAQSIGAKYAIVVAHAILQMTHHLRWNLKGVLLGSAVIDENQLANDDFRMFAFGLVDMKTMDKISKVQDYMAALIQAEAYTRAAEFWHQHIFKVFAAVGYQSPYDVRFVNAFWGSNVTHYMNQANVRRELKMGAMQFQSAGRVCITSEALKPMQIRMRELLNNIKVLFYHGQYDMFAPITHTFEFLLKLHWPDNFDFYITEQNNWYMNKRLAGFWSHTQNLTVLLIRNAGHMVGNTQSKSMLQMLKDFDSGKFEVANYLGYPQSNSNETSDN